MSDYQWTPMTEEERWRNAGAGDILDAAALGDPMASLLMRRLLAADEAMRPEVERLRAEMEREWMEGPSSVGAISLPVGSAATSTVERLKKR